MQKADDYELFDEKAVSPITRGMLKRNPTFERVQEALYVGGGVLASAFPIVGVNLAEYVILAWTTGRAGRSFGEAALAGCVLPYAHVLYEAQGHAPHFFLP